MSLTTRSAADLAGMLTRREVSAEEVTAAHLDRIAAVDGDVHAFLYVDADRALALAKDIDTRRVAREKLGPLAGVPVGVKDVFT
ncbi:MAG TPA: amidase family protein, partial [Propionibacteriaceae bacterium]